MVRRLHIKVQGLDPPDHQQIRPCTWLTFTLKYHAWFEIRNSKFEIMSVDQNEGRFSTLAKRCFSLFFFDLRFGSKLKFVRCTPTDFTPGTAYMERSKDWIFLYLDFFGDFRFLNYVIILQLHVCNIFRCVQKTELTEHVTARSL